MAVIMGSGALTAQASAAFLALFNGGAIKIYGAGKTRPTPSGTGDGTFTNDTTGLLVNIPLTAASAVAGTITATGIPITVTVANTAGVAIEAAAGAGTAAVWYAILTSAGAIIATGTVATSGGDMTVANTSLVGGANFQINGATGTFTHTITK